MTVPPQNKTNRSGGSGQRRQGGGGGPRIQFTYNAGQRPSGPQQGAAFGQAIGGNTGAGRTHSPLGDPDFFTNADIRNYCEKGRSAFLALSFELSMAAEVLSAVLKEVPNADGRPFGLADAGPAGGQAPEEGRREREGRRRRGRPDLRRVPARVRPGAVPCTSRPRQPRRKFDFGN